MIQIFIRPRGSNEPKEYATEVTPSDVRATVSAYAKLGYIVSTAA